MKAVFSAKKRRGEDFPCCFLSFLMGTKAIRYDFIKMATRQKQTNVNEGALTYKAFDSEKTIYPAMCGVKTKAVIARTGTYQGYATNAVELFNPDGRSEVELEQGITLAQDIMNKQRELKARYVKFKSENTAPQPAQGGYGGSYTTVDIRPTASVRAEVDPDDDIPSGLSKSKIPDTLRLGTKGRLILVADSVIGIAINR